MSYWLRSRGMGQAAGGTQLVPLPNYASCDPRDVACTVSNQALSDAYNAQVQQAQAANNAQQCLVNAGNATPGPQRDAALAACAGQYAQQGGAPAAAPAVFTGGPGSVPFSYASPGTLTFASSRGGTALQVGDTWQVTITGAAPGTSVTVSGSMPSGAFSNSVMGRTDGSGNFSKAGTADASTVGNWSETWSVGGSPVGQVQFTVTPVAVPAATTKQTAPAAGTPAAGTPAAGTPAAAPALDLSSLSSPILGFPLWGWLVGGGIAVFAFSGKH